MRKATRWRRPALVGLLGVLTALTAACGGPGHSRRLEAGSAAPRELTAGPVGMDSPESFDLTNLPPPAPPQTAHAATHSVSRSSLTPRRTAVAYAPAGGFAACVRGIESTNNYRYSGYYHGAYNMTISHWDNYGGYARPEDAPPSVQDAKFQSDVAQGSDYMHGQYPTSSRLCGM